MYLYLTTLRCLFLSVCDKHPSRQIQTKVALMLCECQEDKQLRSSAQICRKIHKTWLQEVFVFQIVPPLIVLHVATIA